MERNQSVIQGDLGSCINAVLKPDKIARAYPKLCCSFGGLSIVPDLAVFTWERIPRDADGKVANAFKLAPDWTIEILSPDQSQTKVVRNILHCLDHGTQMGWLIDPDEEMVFVYFANRTIAVFEDKSQRLPVPEFAATIELTIGTIDRWLED